MNIKRFFGKNSREALSMVRKELGDDAVILSNRAMNGGNEIMAFKEEDMNAMVAREENRNHSMSNESIDPPTLLSLLHKSNRTQATNIHVNSNESLTTEPFSTEPFTTEPFSAGPFTAEIDDYDEIVKRAELKRNTPVNKPLSTPKQVATQAAAQATQPKQPSAQTSRPAMPGHQSNLQMTEMLNEMRNMRSVIESQLTAISWANIQQRDPVKSKILSKLLSAGFSAALSRQLTEKMPENLAEDKAIAWIKAILAINLNTIENETEVLDQGGIFALIGPTGVGKTTTTAKLAARYVMKHGTQNLGIITTDAYRIGGHEQLRIYGKILGVMVHAVKDEADLKIALNELKNKHTILIDTVGVSQRDRMVAEQIAMLSSTNLPVKKLLCLNATSTGETLADVIKAYKRKGLDGCIITKLDEAATIGNALDVVIREKLKLFYVANGQRVPEDIHLANKAYLIQHALNLKSISNQPFQFLSDELPFVMGNTVGNSMPTQLAGLSHV
ncbi:flagellar biosynthesis protein FlhF [Methylotenera sp.]|uniref:flagellar biosynthesis protein FlhF n=1 Tax=Methylotenera sp. TaxID=2051956 RepID=UPI002731E56C|nr:flagellar biosynthesis protein FlhF [Methylotenera sp.]MDP2229587.1 flagellar biosynthesis protein FlhF [Methylotenera sp.]MDP3141501.1 flagellar biosynthesis protein FlhF [Methylotenera sp.]